MKPTLTTVLTVLVLMAAPIALTACDQKTETKETKKETTTINNPAPAPDQSTTTTTTTTEKKD